jgi:hypothetical protein
VTITLAYLAGMAKNRKFYKIEKRSEREREREREKERERKRKRERKKNCFSILTVAENLFDE